MHHGSTYEQTRTDLAETTTVSTARTLAILAPNRHSSRNVERGSAPGFRAILPAAPEVDLEASARRLGLVLHLRFRRNLVEVGVVRGAY